MRIRLLAAWMTYWSRPLVWVLGLLWLASFVGLYLMSDLERDVRVSHPQVEKPRGTITAVDQLEAVRPAGRQADVKGLSLRRLSGDLTRIYFDRLGPNPDVEGMRRDGWSTRPDVQGLLEEFPQLEVLICDGMRLSAEDFGSLRLSKRLRELSLSGARLGRLTSSGFVIDVEPIAGDDLRVLSELMELEVLDLRGADFAGGLQHLSGLPKLHTLILTEFEHLNDAALADLRHLLQLQTLVIVPVSIDEQPGDAVDGVTDDGLRALAEIPDLRTVYIVHQGAATVPMVKLRSMLPGVRVRRGFYSEDRVGTGGGFPIIPCMIVAILLCFHPLSLYAQPAAHLLPRYSPAHQVLPALVQGMTIVGMTVATLREGAAFLPSVALATTWLAVALWYFYIPTSRVLWRRGVTAVLALIAFAVFFVAMIGSVIATVKFQVEYDAFLLGDAGWVVSLAILIVSTLAIVQWNRLLPQEAQRFAATGTTAVLGWKDMSQMVAKQQQMSTDDSWVSWLFQRSDRFLETALRHAGHGTWSQLQMWRAGVARTGLSSAVLAVIVGIMGMSVSLVETYQSGSFGAALMTGRDLMTAVIFSLYMGDICRTSWRNRMPGMASESLWPQTRENLRRLTFLGVLLDMVPPLLVSLGWLTLACIFSPPESRTPAMILGMLSVWTVAVLALYAFVMWMLLMPRLWVSAVGSVVTTSVAIGVVLGLVAIRHPTNELEFNPVDLMTVAAGLFVVAGLGLAYAWRRWGTVEFGMLDR